MPSGDMNGVGISLVFSEQSLRPQLEVVMVDFHETSGFSKHILPYLYLFHRLQMRKQRRNLPLKEGNEKRMNKLSLKKNF